MRSALLPLGPGPKLPAPGEAPAQPADPDSARTLPRPPPPDEEEAT